MITKTPVIGKYLLMESMFISGHCSVRIGKITNISGKRIYVSIGESETFVNKFVAVCDTIEEAKHLVNFSKETVAGVQDYFKNRQDIFNNFITK